MFRHFSLISIGEQGACLEIDVSSEPGVAALGRDLRTVMAGEVEVARGFASTVYFREGGKWVGGGEFSVWPRRFRRRRRYAPYGAV